MTKRPRGIDFQRPLARINLWDEFNSFDNDPSNASNNAVAASAGGQGHGHGHPHGLIITEKDGIKKSEIPIIAVSNIINSATTANVSSASLPGTAAAGGGTSTSSSIAAAASSSSSIVPAGGSSAPAIAQTNTGTVASSSQSGNAAAAATVSAAATAAAIAAAAAASKSSEEIFKKRRLQQSSYIRLKQEQIWPLAEKYELADSDLIFLKDFNAEHSTSIKPDDLEELIEIFEIRSNKDFIANWIDIIPHIPNSLRDACSFNLLESFYHYWRIKRDSIKRPLLRVHWKPNFNDKDPHVAFRPRVAEKMKLRGKSKQNDEEQHQKLSGLRDEKLKYLLLIKQLRLREQIKETVLETASLSFVSELYRIDKNLTYMFDDEIFQTARDVETKKQLIEERSIGLIRQSNSLKEAYQKMNPLPENPERRPADGNSTIAAPTAAAAPPIRLRPTKPSRITKPGEESKPEAVAPTVATATAAATAAAAAAAAAAATAATSTQPATGQPKQTQPNRGTRKPNADLDPSTTISIANATPQLPQNQVPSTAESAKATIPGATTGHSKKDKNDKKSSKPKKNPKSNAAESSDVNATQSAGGALNTSVSVVLPGGIIIQNPNAAAQSGDASKPAGSGGAAGSAGSAGSAGAAAGQQAANAAGSGAATGASAEDPSKVGDSKDEGDLGNMFSTPRFELASFVASLLLDCSKDEACSTVEKVTGFDVRTLEKNTEATQAILANSNGSLAQLLNKLMNNKPRNPIAASQIPASIEQIGGMSGMHAGSSGHVLPSRDLSAINDLRKKNVIYFKARLRKARSNRLNIDRLFNDNDNLRYEDICSKEANYNPNHIVDRLLQAHKESQSDARANPTVFSYTPSNGELFKKQYFADIHNKFKSLANVDEENMNDPKQPSSSSMQTEDTAAIMPSSSISSNSNNNNNNSNNDLENKVLKRMISASLKEYQKKKLTQQQLQQQQLQMQLL